jgi:lysozyme
MFLSWPACRQHDSANGLTKHPQNSIFGLSTHGALTFLNVEGSGSGIPHFAMGANPDDDIGGVGRHIYRMSRAFIALLLMTLAACSGAPGIPHRLDDSDPYDWGRMAPADQAVHGVDVSRWQGEIDWPKVARSGLSFAYIKATEGGDVADPLFKQNWRNAARVGLARGAYHFYYLCRPADEQAKWFIAHVPRQAGALPPVLDIEWNHQSRTCRIRPDPAHIRAEIRVFQQIVGAHYGQRPLIYTTVDFWRDNQLAKLGGEEFWLRSTAGHPRDTFPGQRWSFWQYTGTGVVPGIAGAADLNAFAGSEETWLSWLAQRRL